MADVMLNRDDITVEENIRECEVCTVTITGPDYRVMVDLRSAGFASPVIETACKSCAEEAAARIKEGVRG